MVFTLNNWTQEELDIIRDDLRRPSWVKYLVFQAEIGASGTPHLQGYLEMTVAKSPRTCRTKIPGFSRGHFEPRRGTQAQAIAYAKKTDSRDPREITFEWGTPKKQRSGDLIEAIHEGASLRELAESHPGDIIRHPKGIQMLVELSVPPRDHPMKILIFHGPTGTGKSFTARDTYPEAYYCKYPERGSRFWWNGYAHEQVVIMDEFRCQVRYDFMLKLTDRYPMQVEYKGGMTQMNSEILVITTNIEPETWYHKGVPDRSALFRRINQFGEVWDFNSDTIVADSEEEVRAKIVKVQRDLATYPLVPKRIEPEPDFSRPATATEAAGYQASGYYGTWAGV